MNKWATRKKKDNKQAIHKFQNRLNELYEADVDDTVLGEIIEAKLAINLEVDKREIHWEQRGRTNWLRYGDHNTNFFHNYASFRCKVNRIQKLKDGDEVLRKGEEEKLDIAYNYFKGIF